MDFVVMFSSSFSIPKKSNHIFREINGAIPEINAVINVRMTESK